MEYLVTMTTHGPGRAANPFTPVSGGGCLRRREGRGIDAHRYATVLAAGRAASRGRTP
jgi:hypothetical protein